MVEKSSPESAVRTAQNNATSGALFFMSANRKLWSRSRAGLACGAAQPLEWNLSLAQWLILLGLAGIGATIVFFKA